MQGALPFLIDWGDTPHPAAVVPVGGRFEGLVVEHPEVAAVREACVVLDTEIDVRAAPVFGLTAAIGTPTGVRYLR